MKLIKKLPLVVTLISPIFLFGCVATVDGGYVNDGYYDGYYPAETVTVTPQISVGADLPFFFDGGYGGGWGHHGHHGGFHGGHHGGHHH